MLCRFHVSVGARPDAAEQDQQPVLRADAAWPAALVRWRDRRRPRTRAAGQLAVNSRPAATRLEQSQVGSDSAARERLSAGEPAPRARTTGSLAAGSHPGAG